MFRLELSRAGLPGLLFALPAIAALLTALNTAPARGQDDLMDFVPDGGRTLLAGLIAAGAPEAAIEEMVTGSRDAGGWQSWIDANRGTVAGLDALDEYETATLAGYLSNVAPLDSAGLSGADLAAALPRDGRDMALRDCQSCHIITVPITQDRTRDAWLGTLGKPSHVEIDLNEQERRELADYLEINAGIPIDLVPPALRAGGASY